MEPLKTYEHENPAFKMGVPKRLQMRLLQDEIELACKKFGVKSYIEVADAAMTAIAKAVYQGYEDGDCITD